MYRYTLLLVVFFALARNSVAMDIAFCHMTVPDGEVGVLQANLDCAGEEAAVTLGRDSTLQMNGHRVSGGYGATLYDGIDCEEGTCTVTGPGEIDGFTDPEYGGGIGGEAKRIYLSDLDIHHNKRGVHFFGKSDRVIATNVTVRDNALEGMRARMIVATNVTATGNGDIGLAVHWLGYRGRLVGSAIEASGNAGDGVFAGMVRADGLVVQGNDGFGVNARSLRTGGSTLTGNGLALSGNGAGVDLLTKRQPSLTGTTCGRSARNLYDAAVGDDWNVCTAD